MIHITYYHDICIYIYVYTLSNNMRITHLYTSKHTHTYIYTHMCIYAHMLMI